MSEEALKAELDTVKARLADAQTRAGYYQNENEKLMENLEKSEVQRKLLVETDHIRKEMIEKNDEMMSKFLNISSKTSEQTKILVSSNRKIDRFKDKPVHASDPTIEEWIRDVECQLCTRKLEGEPAVLFVLDHLAGKARLEMLGRFENASKTNVQDIFEALRKTFGDGDTKPQLLQKFFSYTQQPNEDLVTLSLKLLEMFDRIAKDDSNFSTSKSVILKDRLAEAVRDEGLKRELRRLNTENSTLSFFKLRDRGDKWLGTAASNKHPVVEEMGATGRSGRLEQPMDFQKLKKEIVTEVVEALSKTTLNTRPSARTDGHSGSYRAGEKKEPNACWECGSEQHFKRDCETFKARKARKQAVNQENDIAVSEKMLEKAIGVCPHTMVTLEGVSFKCLIDTGAEISTITESYFTEHLKRDLMDVSRYLKITAANGLQIPFLGYFEADISLFGRTFPKAGFLVVRDPHDEKT